MGLVYVEFFFEFGMYLLDICNLIFLYEIGFKFMFEFILKSYGRDCVRKWDMVVF